MTRRLGQRGIIGKRRLRSGKGKKFRTYPKGFRATEKKGEGERGLGRASHFPHYTQSRRAKERRGEALLQCEMLGLVG